MHRSSHRVLTSHTGSLPRPDDLLAMVRARLRGEPVDEAAYKARLHSSVREIVQAGRARYRRRLRRRNE
jgi:5-methyltetrahydropteroyltriglutamate--homocysteine methyltransferase